MNNVEDPDPYWFTTYTGKKFHIFNPTTDEIDIEDIAHALSLICRYGGHLPEHYSVAQHSVVVSLLVADWCALEALLHDAEEAYTGDMVRPFKRHPSMGRFSVVAQKIEHKIQNKFNLFPWDLEKNLLVSKVIKEADNVALMTEKRDLFPKAKNHVWKEEQGGLGNQPAKFSIPFVHPGFAKQMFLKRFYELWQKRNSSEQK